MVAVDHLHPPLTESPAALTASAWGGELMAFPSLYPPTPLGRPVVPILPVVSASCSASAAPPDQHGGDLRWWRRRCRTGWHGMVQPLQR